MKWYKDLKEKYNNIFNNDRKKAALKLSIGIIFFVLVTIFLYYDNNSNKEVEVNEYSYKTTLELLEDKKDVITSLETYIDSNYAFSYENEAENCIGKVYNKKHYIDCGNSKYYFNGTISHNYLNNKLLEDEVDTTKYFYNIDNLKSFTYIKNETNFDGSKTYYYEKGGITTNITFYEQDLLKIEDNNAIYIFKDYGNIKEKDVIQDFE